MWWRRLGFCLLVGCLALLCALGPVRAAQAQGCHEGSLRNDAEATLRVEATGLVASYANDRYVGEYQGGVLSVRFGHPRFALDASLPGYHITRNGLADRGLGDVRLGGRASLLRIEQAARERLELGPALDLTLPSGDPARGLGMGHVMLMPGLFVRVVRPLLTIEGQLAYGRALGMAGGHVHGPQPIVQPMNRSELEHALALRVALLDWLGAFGRLSGAIPVADLHGAARESLGLGLDFVVGAFDVAFEQQLPLVGDPFRSRSLLRVGAQW